MKKARNEVVIGNFVPSRMVSAVRLNLWWKLPVLIPLVLPPTDIPILLSLSPGATETIRPARQLPGDLTSVLFDIDLYELGLSQT